MKNKKEILIVAGVFIIISILVFFNLPSTGKAVSNSTQVQTYPLSQVQIETFNAAIQGSGILEDIPNNAPLQIFFYDFENGQRIWRQPIVTGEGEPLIQVMIHSKYISEMNSKNLCEIVKTANQNGDLEYYTDKNKATLLLKYSSMLKYRDCL
ncbi:MAG: hypothetical protein WDZ77_00485 [Candidatus Pacearchaeota archaeon]